MPRWTPKALEAVGWMAMAVLLGLCITQWFGIEGRRTIGALQALTPYVLLAAVPVAVIATTTRRHPLALAALIPLVSLLALTFPIVFHDHPPTAVAGSPQVSIAFGNTYAWNQRPDLTAAAMATSGADVLVMVEVMPWLRTDVDKLVVLGDYPYRQEVLDQGTENVVLWSRYPIVEGGIVEIGGRPAADVVLDVDGRQLRVVGVHTVPPTTDADAWAAQLIAIGDHLASSTLPTIVVGDFNASRFHPGFRRLLDRGWQDSHEALGHGWSMSWPMDHGLLPPSFVRIDHALFGRGATPVKLRDLRLPGSDHKGFVATFGFTSAA